MASHFGHVEIVRLLLSQANIDLNKKKFNKSALDSAKKNIQLLTEAGAQ
jgi:hypothetical protein